MTVQDEETWTALRRQDRTVFTQIYERNKKRMYPKMWLRKIPAKYQEEIFLKTFDYLRRHSQSIVTDQPVDTYLSELLSNNCREWIKAHTEEWYRELDKEEVVAPGSKALAIKLVFDNQGS